MGQDELVLRVSGGPAPSDTPGGGPTPMGAGGNGGPGATAPGKARLTHSRESSGASVKVNELAEEL